MAEEDRNAVLFSSGFVGFEARVPSWDKAPALKSLPDIIKELNSAIKRPVIVKVTNLGDTWLDFSNERFIEENDLSYEELLKLQSEYNGKRKLQSSVNNQDK